MVKRGWVFIGEFGDLHGKYVEGGGGMQADGVLGGL